MRSAPVDPAALAELIEPAAPARMLPPPAYTSDATLAWERTHLFADSWVGAGRVADLDGPGHRRAVQVGEDALVLVRGDDGALRAFHNVCRHRGHELLPDGATARDHLIRCPYHDWTYGTDGDLRFTPRYEAPAGFDPGEHPLVPVRVEEWGGWAFVNASGDAPPLAEHLGDLDAELSRWDPARLVVAEAHTYEVAANWKLVVENYHECFHCPAIHPDLCRVSPPASGQNSAGHAGLWVGGWMALADGVETMSFDGRAAGDPLPGLDEVWRRRVHYLGLLPSFLISPHPDYVMTHRLEPLAPDRTRVECQWLVDPSADVDVAGPVDFWDLTNRQDWAACESVQRGLRSRGFRPGPFSEAEDAVAQFVRAVAQAYLAGGWPAQVPFAAAR